MSALDLTRHGSGKPLAIDLYAGLGGWSHGLLAEGWQCVGIDIEEHVYGGHRYPAGLIIQDVLTVDGKAFSGADLIVASPPCQEFSWLAMPWSKAKQVGRALRDADCFPVGYRGSRTIEDMTRLFNACFRIQREASAAAGRHIPLIVENVRGAVPWVGRSRWNFGSYHLWGDVPALMPTTLRARKFNPDRIDHPTKNSGGSWFGVAHDVSVVANNPVSIPADGRKLAGFRFDGSGRSFQSASVDRALSGEKGVGPTWDAEKGCGAHGMARWTNPAEGRKGAGSGAEWFDQNLCRLPSKSPRRKAASAMIAKIPEPLARWVARAFHPGGLGATGEAA